VTAAREQSYRVEIHNLDQGRPIIRTDAVNTYVKAGLFCLYRADGRVEKYPIHHIFRIVEDYS
jgi:hypothetical protein